MEAISIGHLALRHHISWDDVPAMAVYFNGEQVIEGKATGFTNAAIEAAIIHSRAILEFLGFQLLKDSVTKIAQRSRRTKSDDYGVEKFSGLSMLTKDKALSAYPGAQSEAEAALALIFYLANKGLAHTTASFTRQSGNAHLLEIAFRGVPTLLVNAFYDPLGITPHEYKLKSRPRVVQLDP
jgi:hypothetical protein